MVSPHGLCLAFEGRYRLSRLSLFLSGEGGGEGDHHRQWGRGRATITAAAARGLRWTTRRTGVGHTTTTLNDHLRPRTELLACGYLALKELLHCTDRLDADYDVCAAKLGASF